MRLVIALLDDRRRRRDDDEMVAAGALDLSAGKLAVALDVLFAMRTGNLNSLIRRMARWRSVLSNAYPKTPADPNSIYSAPVGANGGFK